jgi:hypothetical protein
LGECRNERIFDDDSAKNTIRKSEKKERKNISGVEKFVQKAPPFL